MDSETIIKPEWYWDSLHDTLIERREYIDYLSMGYPKRTDRKLKNFRNCLRFHLDTRGTIGDRDICIIEFFNYKEITKIDDFKGWSWKNDELQLMEGKYILRIDFMPPYRNAYKIINYYIRFTDCRVIR